MLHHTCRISAHPGEERNSSCYRSVRSYAVSIVNNVNSERLCNLRHAVTAPPSLHNYHHFLIVFVAQCFMNE